MHKNYKNEFSKLELLVDGCISQKHRCNLSNTSKTQSLEYIYILDYPKLKVKEKDEKGIKRKMKISTTPKRSLDS